MRRRTTAPERCDGRFGWQRQALGDGRYADHRRLRGRQWCRCGRCRRQHRRQRHRQQDARHVSDNSDVKARGNAAGTDVYNGTLGAATAMPGIAGGKSGAIDIDGDGSAEGNVGSGASFNVRAVVRATRMRVPIRAAAVSAARRRRCQPAPPAASRPRVSIVASRVSVTAVGNEKAISVALGVAGAGAAAVTGAATANAGFRNLGQYRRWREDQRRRCRRRRSVGARQAADSTLVVQTVGTFSVPVPRQSAGAANTVVVAKKTGGYRQRRGQRQQRRDQGRGQRGYLRDRRQCRRRRCRGVGAAANVAVVANETTASVDAGAKINATGGPRGQGGSGYLAQSVLVAGAGGIAGVSGASRSASSTTRPRPMSKVRTMSPRQRRSMRPVRRKSRRPRMKTS